MKNEAMCAVVLGCLVACNTDVPEELTTTDDEANGDSARVTGTLMYRERMALPPGSVAEVWLLDTSLADVPAVEIAHLEIQDPGGPPIPFVLEYDPQEIRHNIQYSVRATIRHAGRLLFTSDSHYPVLTRGAGNTADVMLVIVDRAPGPPDATGKAIDDAKDQGG